MSGPMRFRFLNEAHRVESAGEWNSPDRDKLWLYNLHYFDDLNMMGRERRKPWHQEYVRRWLKENPPFSGNGWESYPTSVRIVNWVKYQLSGCVLSEGAVESLAMQCRWLRMRLEYHLLANHLIANAKALIFGGLFFRGEEADGWLRKGLSLLRRQIREQVLPDGGHFERSPMYHSLIAEDLLDVANVLQCFSRDPPKGLLFTIASMGSWLRTMSHPDGDVAFFNDTTLGVAAKWEELDRYARKLGIALTGSTGGPLDQRAFSGMARLSGDGATVLLDAGAPGPSYQPGHAHAETLSFEMSIGTNRVLVNSGISRYGVNAERLRQRGTRAHNTMVIDDQDSSEVWAGFRLARRCKIVRRNWEVRGDAASISASHDGYRHLTGRPIHGRTWTMDARHLSVEDEITGGGEHTYELVFHLHPKVEATPTQGGWNLSIAKRPVATVRISGPGARSCEPATWHPAFGMTVPNTRLVIRHCGGAPVNWVTRVDW